MAKQSPKKKDSSSSRISSSQGQSPTKEVVSLAVSSSEGPGEIRRSRFPIWPEWNETEVSAEKWDAAKGAKDGKAGKSPLSQFFEDPEGKVELPPSLKVHTWKRPSEHIVNKVPVVVENEATFDLTSSNEHLLSSELIRFIISEIYIVWKVCIAAGVEDKVVSVDTAPNPWRPWEHIYSLCKATKGHMPLYNVYGKYVVRLYWMGCWRKLTIDDSLPFDDKNNLLLPATTSQSELWPMLLAKAILKLANTDAPPVSGRELREFSVIHCLTGWTPELLPLQSRHVGKLWEFLQDAIPKFQGEEGVSSERCASAASTHSQAGECKSASPSLNKEQEKKRSREGERERKANGTISTVANEAASTQSTGAGQPTAHNSGSPQMVVCASYQPLHLQEKKTSMLGQMADSSERLRQYGFSQLYSHSVLLTRTRACPLVAAPKTPPVPRWKLVRPRKESNITDEPKEAPIQEPEQYIEVASPFLNFRLMSLSAQLQLDLHLNGHRKRGHSSNLTSFDEADEGEESGPAHHAATCDRIGSLDSAHTTEVTAHDKKDEGVVDEAEATEAEATEAEATEPELSSLSDKMKDKEKEGTRTKSGGPDRAMLQETWLHLHHFPQCFQTLLVFHKPNTYTYNSQKSQFKSSVTTRASATALTGTTASTNSAMTSRPLGSSIATPAQGPDEKGSHFLFVDSLLPTEILMSFSALVLWGDSMDEIKECICRPGFLTAEPFSWKSTRSHFPWVNIHTTACKAAVLSLPPGRHVFCIHTRAPLGFHLQLYSMTSFVFGEEDTVMSHLTKESVRFCEQALLILRALGGVVGSFSDPQTLPSATRALEEALFPLSHGKVEHREHWRVFNEAVYHMFCSVLGRKLTSEELFAIQALTGDRTLHYSNMKETNMPSTDGAPEGWSGRQASEQEKQAATILQAGWRGYLVREILSAARPGSEENQKVSKTLLEMWASVELNVEKHAVFLLSHLVTYSERVVELYPCDEDEWTRITFIDYTVPVSDISNSWVMLFREVFHVPKPMLLVPKIYSPFPACILHVINNDTGEELPRIFHKIEPYVYTQNKAGYTFVAEAYTGDTPLVGGKWRMRLIGSREPLPQLAREAPVNNFSLKEIKDYYIPNEKNIICRHAVKVSCDHVATVQFQTSRADVHVKLSILDHGREVASNQAKGHVIIPVYCFLANNDSSGSGEERAGVVRSEDDGGQGGGVGKEVGLEDPPPPEPHPAHVVHKYIVQAEVLHKSWPLDDSLSAFIQTLRDVERSQMRVVGDKMEDVAIHVSVDPPTSERPKSATPKNTKKTKDKEKEKPLSKPVSRTLDVSKPHWTLRVVSEASAADRIEVKKDTERLDQIKAIKQAWETAEPGRAAKARQSRLQFINKQPTPSSGSTAEGSEACTPETGSVSAPHHYNYDMDYTPFIRRSGRPVRLKDALIEEEQKKQRSEMIQSFRLLRDTVLEHRERELVSRRELKRRQLETYDSLQVALTEQRRTILQAREAFRSRLLEEESRKKENELALEALHRAELEKNQLQPAPPTTRKSGGKKK